MSAPVDLGELELSLESLGVPLQRCEVDSDVVRDRGYFHVATAESVGQAWRIISAVNDLPALIASLRAAEELADAADEIYVEPMSRSQHKAYTRFWKAVDAFNESRGRK